MISKSWDQVLKGEYEKTYFKNLIKEVNKLYEEKIVYPKKEDLFKAFKLTDFDKVKVVIIGQDPYHTKGVANGLAFSVNRGVKRPPSLNNIFKELESDLGIKREDNNLEDWARQGVFLINSILTVEEGRPSSHKYLDWEKFTNQVIKEISNNNENIVFILLGNFAKSKAKLIDEKKHLVLKTSHPSFFSCNKGFFGSKIFSKTNAYLKEHNKKTIDF